MSCQDREFRDVTEPHHLTPSAAARKYAAMDDADVNMRFAASLPSLLDDTLVPTASLPADEDDRAEHGERWDFQD